MPKFSKRSLANLDTCDERLQNIAKIAIRYIDFTVIQGHRTIEEQRKNVEKGVSWTMNSKHCESPSHAFDFVPYPFKGWDDKDGFNNVATVLLAVADALGVEGRWGGDWNKSGSYKDEIQRGSYDGGHFELI